MRPRSLIVGIVLEAYGLWRLVADFLGDADLLTQILSKDFWLHSGGPALIGVALILWAFLPELKKLMTDSKDDQSPRGAPWPAILFREDADDGWVHNVTIHGHDIGIESHAKRTRVTDTKVVRSQDREDR